jgi:hypothetical protein
LNLLWTVKRAVTAIRLVLRSGRTERFDLPVSCEDRISKELVRAARSEHAAAEAEGLLRLMVALETRLESPTAAERLRSLMRATPELCAVIRNLTCKAPRPEKLAAPKFGARAPEGTLRLREFLRPSRP